MAEGTAMTLEDIMNRFHSEIGPEKLRELMHQFNGASSIDSMFRALWNVEEAHRCLTPSLVHITKSQEEANRLRGLGNDHLARQDLDKALEMFNKSIMAAPHPDTSLAREVKSGSQAQQGKQSTSKAGETLSLCYARRSAVFFEMKQYDICLSDIARAEHCPKLQSELDERRKKCMELQKNQQTKTLNEKEPVPDLLTPNPIMPCFSSSCKIAYMNQKGRHIIASKDIRPGDVLLVEKAYCCSPYLEKLSTCCSTCLNECLAPLPCPYCPMNLKSVADGFLLTSGRIHEATYDRNYLPAFYLKIVVFCSSSCRQEGLSGSHRLECNILPTLFALDMMPSFVNVFKLLGNLSCKEWRNTLEKIEIRQSKFSPEKKGVNDNDIFSSEDFELFYSLCTNASERPCGDLYVKCLIAFVLMKLLHLGGRLFVGEGGVSIEPEQEDLIFIGRFFFSNLMKISCNAPSVYELKCTIPPLRMKKKDMGAGVYPSFALLNHSCNSNALPYFYGRNMVIRAMQKISEGEEITISYCRGCYLQPLEDRQLYLDNLFQFECGCEACEDNWSLYPELSQELGIKCSLCSRAVSEKDAKCSNCDFDYTKKGSSESEKKAVSQWKATLAETCKAKEKLQSVMKGIMAGSAEVFKDFNALQMSIEQLQKFIPAPSQILWDARDTLELYFHVKQSINLA